MSDDLAANYAGAFGGHLVPGRVPALLIVDVVMAYLDPLSPLYAAGERALDANERLVVAARGRGMPIVFTRVEFQAGGRDGGHFYRKVPALKAFLKGDPSGAFPPTLHPDPADIVVTKQYASAFFGTSLAATLRALGADMVFVTGFSTSGCVRASALDALQHGFIPFVVADACADRNPAPHEATLFDLQAKYAEVVSLDRALELMRGDGAAG